MSLQSLLGIDLPIIQAPMAGSQDHALAVAVSNAGGLGSLPCAMLGADALRAELVAIKAQTDRPYNLNFFCHATPVSDPVREARWRAVLEPYYRAFDLDPGQLTATPARLPFDAPTAELLEEFRPAVVSFHFGLPSHALLETIRRWDCKVLSTATTVEEARWLEARGVDAVIAQGLEAGGHRGHFLSDDLTRQSGIFALLPRIVDAVRVPVIAAGGIADHRAVVAALALGASGVQVGTAFLLCPEATTSAVHRAALADGGPQHTALTNLFSGRPARGLVNRCMRELGPMNPLAPEFPLAAAAMAPLRAYCERQGSGDFSPLWSGQNPDGCRNIPAAKLTRQLAGRA
ncbi:NAD(P)H-dependent flavin oxidoreductase [Pseudoxanthomonas yeongjuensis]|uniref:NAD(P)H-dependent flavin oxidoreductase n=1 Tax=Pseudoxanthomonas yeongjuensis TaxID=377616 RepID=UPI001B869E84|nr:nitronate monooxygenase [Pseudoxanthomonas yeongjuensis]